MLLVRWMTLQFAHGTVTCISHSLSLSAPNTGMTKLSFSINDLETKLSFYINDLETKLSSINDIETKLSASINDLKLN